MIIHLIVGWLVAALALYIMAKIVPGIAVQGFGAAMIAAAVIALVDMTLGWILAILTFPLNFLTLGLFRFVIYAVVLKVSAGFTSGFRINGFVPALIGAIVLTLVKMILQYLVF